MHTTPSSRRSLRVGTMLSVSHCIRLRSTGGSHPTWPSARASASRAALSGTKTRETFRMARTTQRRSFTSWSMWMARVLRLAGSHRLVCTHRMTLSNEHSMKAAAACTLGCANYCDDFDNSVSCPRFSDGPLLRCSLIHRGTCRATAAS
jgi:hypothetical protein